MKLWPAGDSSCLSTNMFSATSKTPTVLRERRLRCKMCRQELATRDHMLDHGQLDLPTSSQQINTGCDDDSASSSSGNAKSTMPSTISPDANDIVDVKVTSSQKLQLSDSFLVNSSKSEIATSPDSIDQPSSTTTTITRLKGPSDLASELYSNPKLAALRIRPPSHPSDPSQDSCPNPDLTQHRHPILINPKCSGYFVEPMKWMDHFLSTGSQTGKIICPNKKCHAKLGNYDWAGVCCGCKIWVTPGFCINRSKVDEFI